MIFSKAKLFKLKKALLSLNSISTEEGELIYDGDVLQVGNEVFVDGEDGMTPAPDKDYICGEEIITVEGGIVTSIVAKPIEQPVEEVVEEVVEEQPKEEPVVEEEVVEDVVEEQPEEVVEEEPVVEEEIVEEPTVEELNQIIEEQKTVIDDLKKEIEELKRKLEEPTAQSAEDEFEKQTKPINEKQEIDFSKYIKRKNK